jgi:hypothetical protein
MAEKKTKTEEFKVSGEDIADKLKRLVEEGNVRRILVKSKDGRTIADFPLTVGVVGAVLVPALAAIGAIVALVQECSIVVEKDE